MTSERDVSGDTMRHISFVSGEGEPKKTNHFAREAFSPRHAIAGVTNAGEIRGCIQKFPDWPSGARTQMVQLSATSCRFIAIL
jgi:hypothetical protein